MDELGENLQNRRLDILETFRKKTSDVLFELQLDVRRLKKSTEKLADDATRQAANVTRVEQRLSALCTLLAKGDAR